MEPEEIAVVLSRASHIHSNLNRAIQLISSTNEINLQNESCRILDDVDIDAEALSLVSITDALAALQGQLQSLQALQQQQRTERDAGLVQIEESRLILLKRLKEHRGRDLEVVQEALLFAGETNADNEDLPLPPYPRLLDGETSQLLSAAGSFQASGSARRSDTMEEEPGLPDFGIEEDEEGGESDLDVESDYGGKLEREGPFVFALDNMKDSGAILMNAIKDSGALLFNTLTNSGAVLVKTVKNSGASALNAFKSSGAIDFALNSAKYSSTMFDKFVGQFKRRPSKAFYLVIGAVAVISLNAVGRKKVITVSKASSHSTVSSHPPCDDHHQRVTGPVPRTSEHSHLPGPSPGAEKGVPKDEQFTKSGNIMKLDEDYPKCVVRERIELPFYQELTTPDVLFGRG